MGEGPPPNLDNTAGSALIGALISSTLLGVVIVQTYTYYVRFPVDRRAFRYLVLAICFGELVHAVLVSESVYSKVVNRYGDLESLTGIPLSFSISLVFNAITILLIQIFFVYRCFTASQTVLLPAVLGFICILRCGLTLALMAQSIAWPSVNLLNKNISWLGCATLVTGTLTDVVFSMTLLYHILRRRSSHSNASRTSRIIGAIFSWTFRTGIIATLSSVVALTTFFVVQKSFIWLSIFSFNSSVFCILFLASLNNRTVGRLNPIELQQVQLMVRPTAIPPSPSIISNLTQLKQNDGLGE